MAYTDYPDTDIQTHRSVAKWNERFAVIVIFGGLFYGASIESVETGAVAIALGAVAFAVAQSMKIKALRWQLEETENGGNEDDG